MPMKEKECEERLHYVIGTSIKNIALGAHY
jgi:hypothetical protein